MNWNGSPYHTLDFEMKSRFGQKVYKIALDGHMTCPNRDGTLGTRGCIFCSEGGSGDFAVSLNLKTDCSAQNEASLIATAVHEQIEEAISRIKGKMGSAPDAYIAYFQSYTNTYAPLSYLEALFTAAIRHPKIVALSIGTRPDCLPDEVLDLCARVNREKPVWLELGLQTIHEDTAVFIRRGYPLSVFTQAVYALAERNIPVVVHIILGLPGESRETVLRTIDYLNRLPIQGVKLQLLHVLSDSDLADLYRAGEYTPLEKEEYLTLVGDCIAHLRADIVLHRLTGDGDKNTLLAPLWSLRKRDVLNHLHRYLRENHIRQGMSCKIDLSVIYNKPKDVL